MKILGGHIIWRWKKSVASTFPQLSSNQMSSSSSCCQPLLVKFLFKISNNVSKLNVESKLCATRLCSWTMHSNMPYCAYQHQIRNALLLLLLLHLDRIRTSDSPVWTITTDQELCAFCAHISPKKKKKCSQHICHWPLDQWQVCKFLHPLPSPLWT